MRKSFATRFLALLLGLCMLFSLTACGEKTSETEAPAQTPAEASTKAPEDTEAPTEPAPEPITITWLMQEGNMGLGDGIHTDKNAALQYIKDTLGIEIMWITYNADKYTAMLADGDLPDVITLMGNVPLDTMIEAGHIIGLNDLLEQYGQNIVAKSGVALDANRAVNGGTEGECYSLPIMIGSPNREVPNTNGEGGLKIRYDVYQAIGAPEIKSEDDLLEVLKKMQDYERQRTGNDSVYALHMWGGGATFSFELMNRMYGSNSWGSNWGWGYDYQTGEVEWWLDEDSAFMKGVNFYRKAWKMGILDPESFTMDDTVWRNKISSGLALSATTWGDQPDPELCGENAILTYIPGAFECFPGVYFDLSPIGRGYNGNARAISSSCKYPERVMQLLDWLDSDEGIRTIYNGVPGVDWDYIDGVPQFIGNAMEAYKNGIGSQYMENRALVSCNVAYYMASGYNVPTDDGYNVRLDKSLEIRELSTTKAQKNFASQFDPEFFYPGQVYKMWIEQGLANTNDSVYAEMINAFLPALPAEDRAGCSRIYSEQLYNKWAEVVMYDDAEYAEWFQGIQDLKDDEFYRCYNLAIEGYEEAKAKVDEFMNKQ